MESKIQRPILRGKVNFPVCLAPMVGLSHIGLRLLVRSFLPAGAVTIWPTEMLNSRRLPSEPLGSTPETLLGENETELVPQILGNESLPIQKSIQVLKEWGAEGVDINMGCPVKKALKHNYGVALMGDPEYAKEVVKMAVESSSLPVSVKLRAGHQSDEKFLHHFVQGLVSAGAEWICLHPRTAAQKRRGSADWSQIKNLRENLDVAVIGNGDVQVAGDAMELLEQTQCDGVMIGRALTARPWLLWQIGRELGWPDPVNPPIEFPQSPSDEGYAYGRCLILLAEIFKTHFAEGIGLRKFKFYVRTSHPWLDYGNQLVGMVGKSKNYDELIENLNKFFSQPMRLVQKTELRQ